MKVYYSQSQGIVEEKVKVFQNFVYGYLNITLNLYKISKHIGLNTEREKKVKIEPRWGWRVKVKLLWEQEDICAGAGKKSDDGNHSRRGEV